ncbi:MAG TPA: T9SS type A sorting domain-containing protein, partial [Flavobacterium sp.]|nr:T9SS type A sorting domain-containing protein [Flavobacterium sp.]
ALRDMENQLASTGSQTWNHKTSLYISHDAPQQGANIPLGIQYFARHIVDQLVSTPLNDMNINPQDGAPVTVEDIKKLLDATGTKQLLTKTVTSGFVVDDTSSTAWQTELRNLGYPQQTRNIAISNGNHCAIPQAFAPASVLFSLTGNAKATVLTDMVMMLLQPIANAGFTYAAIKFNQPGLMLGVLPGNSKFDMNFTAKALPTTGTTTEIYKGRITFTKKFIWFNITTALTDRSYNNPPGILSYDYYPGGKYNVPFSFQNSSVSNLFFSYGISAVIADNFDFIPTPSALDIGGGGVALTEADYLKKYSSASPPLAPKNSPFANFTTSFPNGANINENHISFNTRNGNWLATELDSDANNNQIFDCSYICSDTQITGSSTLCTSGVYSISSSATNFSWSITEGSNLVSLSGNGTNTVTLTKTGTTSGYVTMVATLSSTTCGSAPITKRIFVGKPSFNVVRASNETCDTKYHYIPFEISNRDPLLNYTYTIGYPSTATKSSQTYNGIQQDVIKVSKTYNDFIEFTVSATNSCGTTSVFREEYVMNNCSSLSSSLMSVESSTYSLEQTTIYTVYPNPSSDIINVNLREENNLPETQTPIVATLYNMMGEEKRNVSIKNNIATIPVNNLPKGIYILKINIDGTIENHQVVVE